MTILETMTEYNCFEEQEVFLGVNLLLSDNGIPKLMVMSVRLTCGRAALYCKLYIVYLKIHISHTFQCANS